MADNVQLNVPTTSGATIATDDLAGIQHQLVKLEFGSDGAATMVSAADPLPTTDAAVLAKLSADPSTETTLAALLAKVIAAPSTEAKQDATNVLLTTIAAITQPLTDVELRATPVPVSGSVTVTAVTSITNALPAGNNNIGDVDVASIAAGTNYIGKVRLTDGVTDGEVVPLAGFNAQAVAIVDGSGAQITSFGGGTQYADGAARGTATGTMMIGDDGTNVQSVKVDSNGILARNISTPTKTQNATVFTLASTAASSVAISSAVDVSTIWGASFFIRFGRRSATAAGAGVNIRIEGSFASSGDNTWIPLAIFTTNFAACEAEAVSGTVNSGTNVITVASTTNLTAGDIIYIDNGTIANSEWARIKSISANVSVTIEDNLVNAQTGATIYDSAEMYVAQLDLSSIGRVRVVVDGSLFTQANTVEVKMVTLSSIV